MVFRVLGFVVASSVVGDRPMHIAGPEMGVYVCSLPRQRYEMLEIKRFADGLGLHFSRLLPA